MTPTCIGPLVRALLPILALFCTLLVPPSVGVADASPTCFSTHASGSGATRLVICISDHGNVVRFESPASFEHLAVGTTIEGYTVCSTGRVHGWDAAEWEDGWGEATVTQPNGVNTFPLTIVRWSDDGAIRLTQSFARDTAEKDVTITMTLANVSGQALSGVAVSRYFDGDIDGDPYDDVYGASADSVWGMNTHALELTAVTWATRHSALVEPYAAFDLGQCAGTPVPAPTAPGDYVGRLTYTLGTVNVGASRTVKFLYRFE